MSSINYVRKIFRRTNISDPLIHIPSVWIDTKEEKFTQIFSRLLCGVALALWLLPENSVFDVTSKETLPHSFKLILATGHLLSTYAKFSEKLKLNVRVRIRGLKMLVFRKILLTYLMDDL